MENVKVIIQKVVAILTVFIIIMTQYVITGLIETTYAIDLLATQSSNVQFRAYFKNGEEEITEIESSIAEKNLKLKIDIAVKNEGYFNGQISLENAGFKLTQATANDYINKLENNVIYLNQINAEETVSIEVGIEYLEEETIAVSTLSEPSTVKLKGTYTASTGNVTIDSGSSVKVTWKIPEGTKAELASIVQTNSIYKVEEENKKIVQYLISSKLTNNAYPIKNIEIRATIPEGATKVEVHKRTTKSTNGEQEFTASNYSIENNVLTINVNNNEIDGKISWMKGVQDIYVVTYEYPESTDLSAQNIVIDETITTQDIDKIIGNPVSLNAEQVQLSLNENKDGISNVSKLENETQMYKGKIYSGEAREFISNTIVYFDYVEGIKEIEIAEEEAKYIKEVEENGTRTEVENNANVEIKAIKINKEKVASVLGNEWNLTIGENQINNSTETDESGNIILSFAEGTKTVTIKTSKPVNNGSFVIETTKRILNSSYTREQLKEFTKLKDSGSVKYIKNNDDTFKNTSSFNIGLKETQSKASLQSEQQALIASDEQQQLNLTAVLESNGEQYDLYKNPVIKIKLPSQIKNVSFSQKPQLMYANNGLDLTEGNYTIEEENGQKVINIRLTGEQTSYLGEAVQGTTVLIKTNVIVDKNAENSEQEIVLNYTNENASIYADQGIEKVNIQIIANQQNQQQNQNQNQQQNQQQNQNNNNGNENNNEQTTNTGLKMELTAKVGGETINNGDTVRAGEIISYLLKVTNPGTADKTGIDIQATIPENTTLIERNPKYPKERFYSDTEIDSGVNDSYFIEKTDTILKKENINIKSGETVELKYLVKTNENITQDTSIETNITVKDSSKEDNLKLQNTISKSNLQVELIPITRTGEEEIKAGYGCIYKVNIKNISNEVQNNVKIIINKNELVNIVNKHYSLEDNYVEIADDNVTFTIDSINSNSTVYMEIDASINPYTEDLKYANLYITATDSSRVNYRSNLLSEPVGGVKIEATLTQKSGNSTSGNVKNGDTINYEIKLKNIGKEDTNELSIKDRISKYVDIQSVTLNGNTYEYIEGTERETENDYYKIATIRSNLKAGEELTIQINCIVRNDIEESGTLSIINKAFVSDVVSVAQTEQTLFYLENIPSKNNSNDENDNDNDGYGDNSGEQNGNSSNNGSNNPNNTNQYTVSGVVWNDENKNGARDANEELIQGINVYAINTKTNGIVVNSTTNTNGQYSLSNIEKGQYLIVFEYDTKKYVITEYKKEGVNEDRNSDAVKVSKIIGGTERNVAITDSLNIESNYSNIDLGLIENQNEKLQLKKTVSNITVTNKEGTKKYNFKNTELAKVEIASKSLNGSTVLIEYSITIKNTGSENIYAKNIVDYLPSSLKFTSSMNKNWYKKNNYLYNSSLSNTPIKPGETKEIKLILTKKMTATNTGLINNKAKIETIYNTDGTEISSDETSSADVIISIKTGGTIIYALFILITILIALEMAYIVKRLIIKLERR